MHVGRWIRGGSVAAVLAATSLIAARPAAADPGSYRAPVVVTDLAAYATLAASAPLESVPLAGLGLAIYALGPPAIHAGHGNWGRAGASLGLRVGAPVVLGALVCSVGTSGSSNQIGKAIGCAAGFALGGVVGVIGAQIVDWSVLAGGYEETTPQMFTIGGTF